MLEYFQILREITGIGNDDANRVFALTSLKAGAPELLIWQTHRHPVDLQGVPADHQSIPERPDLQQAMLIKCGGETRRSLLGRRYFTVDGGGKVQDNARPWH